jgi:phosphoglycerate kinase
MEFSQRPLVLVLEKLLKTTVHFAESCHGPATQVAANRLSAGEVLLLENLSFDPREEQNDEGFAEELSLLGDVYVNDAFTNCHRSHASMVALPGKLPAYMGLELMEEVRHLSSVVENPDRPLALIISGKKIETKIPVISSFLQRGDEILLGGAIANTFLLACGHTVGRSLVEEAFVADATRFLQESEKVGNAVIRVPQDAAVARSPGEALAATDRAIGQIGEDVAIFDVGPKTAEEYCGIIAAARTVVWNGPLGLYEEERFSEASKHIAEAMRQATERGCITIVGGGDTIDFHVRYGLPLDAYTFVSTGGGAMLDFVAGKKMPALVALENSQ